MNKRIRKKHRDKRNRECLRLSAWAARVMMPVLVTPSRGWFILMGTPKSKKEPTIK